MLPPTLIIFWDYDTQWGGDRSRAPGGPKDWGAAEFINTDRLLELHAQYDIPACFAVVGAAALSGDPPYHNPSQIRRIHAAAHEIASHSLYHEWLPGLNSKALTVTIGRSKDALQQCIGEEVVSFVPPFNQPFDYPQGWSFSLSERREAGRERTDLYRLCDALRETGYRFCRTGYMPMHLRLVDRLFTPSGGRSNRIETIAGILCLKVSACGFAGEAIAAVEQCVAMGRIACVYGHPHSLHSGNSQDETWLVPFLQKVRALRDRGLVEVRLPRDLIRHNETLLKTVVR
jgi:peptidoglycan/xylan/chitin deacetylase (PgdA/CDA1 family)